MVYSKAAYEWKTGSCVNADPQAVGEMFEQLAQTEEGLTAETLLEANKPITAPLHDDYDWDNIVAADKWRLHQSRHFLNSLTIKVLMDDNSEPIQTRAVHITTVSHKYEPIQVIVQEPDKYATLLNNALSDLQTFRKKYQVLSELKPIFDELDKLKGADKA